MRGCAWDVRGEMNSREERRTRSLLGNNVGEMYALSINVSSCTSQKQQQNGLSTYGQLRRAI
jgi:hypothetical protein